MADAPNRVDPAVSDDRSRVAAVISRVAARVAEIRAGDAASAPAAAGAFALPPLAPGDRLAALAARAGIDGPGPGLDLLRLLAAGETDLAAHRALQRLGDEPGRPGVEVQALVIVAEYLGRSADAALAAVDPDGLLASRGLVDFVRDTGSLLSRRVALPPRLLGHLRGALAPAPPVPRLAVEPVLPVDRLVAADGVIARARALVAERGAWLVGPRGAGKRTLLAALSAERGQRLLVVEYRDLIDRRLEGLVPTLWREALIGDAVVCVANVAELPGDPPRFAASLYEALHASGLPFAVTSSAPPVLGDFDLPPRVLAVPNPEAAARAGLWRAELAGCERVDELAGRFRLPPGRIVRVAAAARADAAAERRPVTLADVTRAVSAEIAQKVTTLGTKIESTQSWDDLVLPPATLDAMREIVSRARWRHKVLQDWGFERKLSKGLGLSALFAGPPGTGKTMVAGLIARELALELYQIDLSRVVSKYVGETEKNLAEVFDGADWGNVLLLFDEADALFAKRTDVKSSNDRFSNMEVNYLLQRLERFEGISILTTNLATSIDPAFKRRLTFRVEFPMPDLAERELLWRRMMPREAAVDDELDYELLARRYELTGGNIRNALLRAAFLAAGEERGITMDHVQRAVALEYRDAGQIAVGGRLNQ